MGAVSEILQAPPPGTYPVVIIQAEAGLSGKGNTQIECDIEITDGKFKGAQFKDWIGTDPQVRGAGIGRGKLRVLLQPTQFNGLADAAETHEVPDAVIAQALVGQRLFAVVDNSPRKRKLEDGTRSEENMTQMDPATGNLITIMNVDVKGYTRHFAGQAQTAPQQQVLPQGQTFVPVQVQAPSSAAPVAAPQYAQGYAPQAAAPVAQTAPVAAAPQLPFTPNYAPTAAVPPWQQPQANGATTPGEAPAAKQGGRKLKVQDAPQG